MLATKPENLYGMNAGGVIRHSRADRGLHYFDNAGRTELPGMKGNEWLSGLVASCRLGSGQSCERLKKKSTCVFTTAQNYRGGGWCY